MGDITIAITAASYHGNKGAAAMLQSSIKQLYQKYGERLTIQLISVYPQQERRLNPYDFVRVIPGKPKQLLFLAFPLAVLYRLFRWFPPARFLFKKNKLIGAYLDTDMVLDVAGVSFVDSRGFVMNTYAAVTMLVPLLLGVPVVKYSQAIGTFRSGYNRFLAKLVLPRLALICARGEATKQNLADIGIRDNVKLCADGAFSMPEDASQTRAVDTLSISDPFYASPYLTLSLSSVVNKRCAALGLDYCRCMIAFIEYLNSRGYGVLLIANAARLRSNKERNNDLPLCDAIYHALPNQTAVRWYHEEMTPEKIRELIGRSQLLIGSRFHAMIAALERKTPVLLIGWSHKYKEVLDQFKLGECAVDYTQLSLPMLIAQFEDILSRKADIERELAKHLPSVKESSLDNIRFFAQVLDSRVSARRQKVKLLDVRQPECYTGAYHSCRMGYARDAGIRAGCASGGMVTALLCHLLRTGQIDGAWVTRSFVSQGELTYESFIAQTEADIKSCSGSVYMDVPQMKHIDLLSGFSGRLAVVMLPCGLRALTRYLSDKPLLREKVVLRIALYCSGSHNKQSTLLPLQKKGISLAHARRVIFRRGHYRGKTVVQMQDGSERQFSYTKTLCAYKNAYFFAKSACMLCQDHFGREADLSFGDVWLPSMKKNPVKHTSCLIHNETGLGFYRSAVQSGAIADTHFTGKELIRSQKRALVFKYNCAAAKVKAFERQHKRLCPDTRSPCRWNHRLAYALAERNRVLSCQNPKRLAKMPMWFVYVYMLFIRTLLNF